jgi:hypothetical protein
MIEPGILTLIKKIFNLSFFLSSVFLLFVLLYIAILYITAKEESVKKVRDHLRLILIGLFLVFLSVFIPRLITLFFQIRIF